jgi:hypothetical protein
MHVDVVCARDKAPNGYEKLEQFIMRKRYGFNAL